MFADKVTCFDHLLRYGPQRLGDLHIATLRQVFEVRFDNWSHQRVSFPSGFETLQLQEQTLLRIARADAGRSQPLQRGQHLSHACRSNAERSHSIPNLNIQHAIVIEAAD